MTDLEKAIDDAIAQHGEWIEKQQGVVGCDSGPPDHVCFRVFSNGVSEETKKRIVARVGSVPVEFLETGEIQAH